MAKRYVVVGRMPVLGKRRGDHVYLEDDHAARMMRQGHVEEAAEPASTPKPAAAERATPRRSTRRTSRVSAPQSEESAPAAVASSPEPPEQAADQDTSAGERPQEMKEAGDG
ncbi:hypothetical protein [Streptomonospora arabica]|uniref:Uncharacterized protein n=1 Tax=Streptomonospora arabica TaxID=412417 RepID=A0ABV9SST7_9ACTN